MARYNEFQWGPSNLKAQENEAVKSNVSLQAFAKQREHAKIQGQIHGAWWDIAKLLGAEAKAANSDADLQSALNDYDAAIDGVLNMSEDAKQAWSAIGTICGTNWDTDFAMNKVADNTYETDVLSLKAGEEYKVRQGAAWDVNYGVDGAPGGANIVVEADGNYKIQLILDGETATINLIPA